MSAPTTNYHQMEDDGNNNVVINNDSDHPNYVHISSAPNAHRIRSPRPDVKQQDSNLSFFETEPQDDNPIPDDVPYVVKQKYGYFAILFSLAQTAILIIMMVKCGIAPFKINPMIGPYPDALSEWGGKNAVNILDDQEYWRLLTPILLHAGVIHLFCNVAVQLETGAFFEREWGSLNWLIIYLTSAVGSSILSCIFMPNSVSVGSSGAVMGLFGGKLAEVMCRCCESKKTVQGRIGHEVRREQLGGVLCSVVLVMAFSFIPYVDWAAHLGGLVAGILIGLPVFSCTIKTVLYRVLWFMVGMLVTAFSFYQALQYLFSGAVVPAEELRDVCGYYQQFFDDYQCQCMRAENQA